MNTDREMVAQAVLDGVISADYLTDLELEEIEYNKVKYYKDAENFIYSIDKDDQPSENPIGYWKDKTSTIAFYKSK
jgi:hypothetical protein